MYTCNTHAHTHTHTCSHSALSQNMRVVDDPADFLGNPSRYIFNHTLINRTLCSLSPENSIIFVGSHRCVCVWGVGGGVGVRMCVWVCYYFSTALCTMYMHVLETADTVVKLCTCNWELHVCTCRLHCK